jgi:glycosyltransferase involved in cell wall biosynthesis
MDCYPDVAERTGVLRPNGLVSRVARALKKALLRRLDGVVCLDEAMAEFLAARYAPRAHALRFSVIPNWEPAEFYRADPRPAPLAELKGGADQFVVLYSGNAGYGHHFETVLEAAELLRQERVRFLFVGGGPRWEWIEEAARARGLAKVVFQPYVHKRDVPRVLATGDCALITLRDDMVGVMSPSKVHSCLALGLPLVYVGPEGSNVDQIVRRFGCGVSLRVGDARGLAEAVLRLKNSPQERSALGRRARQAFEEAHSDLRAMPQFDALIAEVMKPRQ